MKRSVKKAAALILAMLLAAALSACGSKQEEAPAEETEAAETAPAEETEAAETKAAETKSAAEVPKTAAAAAAETETSPQEEEPEPEGPRIIRVRVGSDETGLTDKESNTRIATVTTAGAELPEEEAKEYPQLAEALKVYTAEAQKFSGESAANMLEIYEEMKANRPEELEYYELLSEAANYVLRADSRAVSLMTYTYCNLGGAHPDYYWRGLNLDPETGNELKLSDVITDMAGLTAVVKEKLTEKYPEDANYWYSTPEELLAAADTEDSYICWNIGYEGLQLIFNPYSLGPWAMGWQTVTVYYDENPALFAVKYTETPESWIVPIVESLPVTADVTGSGMRELIYVEEEVVDGEAGVYGYSLVCGERTAKVGDYAYRIENYLVRANGQYYTWSFEHSDNDYVILSCVDLKTMIRDAEGSFNGYIPDLYYDWSETETGYETHRMQEAFTDPEIIILATRTNFLSTMDGTRPCYAGKKGTPVSDQDHYDLKNVRVLKAKKELTADTVDEAGNVTGTEKLKPGTYLYFIRTDDESYADFQTVDASEVSGEETEYYSYYQTETAKEADWSRPVYRIREEKTGWPYTVNGADEEEMLGGIGYAG